MEIKCLDHTQLLKLLPDRRSDAHKGNFGRLLLLCGSLGYTGAAALAAMGALRTGAGLVYLGVPDCIYEIEAAKLNEPIVFPLDDDCGTLAASSIAKIEKRLQNMDAVLIGPGIGQSAGTLEIIRYILLNFNGPIVLDADGINQLSAHMNIVRGRTGTTILTPHEGEFLRVGGTLKNGRRQGAEQLALDLGVIVVLKGRNTVITDGNSTYINSTGNPGMAVGGSGDVLAGMITSLVGQGIAPLEAAACGAWLHGAAGDICAEELGQYAMLPSDMLTVLPRLLK